MDPAAVLLNVNTLAAAVQYVQNSYQAVPATFGSIHAELKTLGTHLERIQEWQHYTDPRSEAQILPSLKEVMSTVGPCIHQFQTDLESPPPSAFSTSGPSSGNDGDRKGGTSLHCNDSSLKRHLVNVSQCASLMQFMASVCQQ